MDTPSGKEHPQLLETGHAGRDHRPAGVGVSIRVTFPRIQQTMAIRSSACSVIVGCGGVEYVCVAGPKAAKRVPTRWLPFLVPTGQKWENPAAPYPGKSMLHGRQIEVLRRGRQRCRR
jgi:hypothetical protein